MGKEKYKQIRSDLEARIIYDDFDGECFKKDEDGNFNKIVLVSMPDGVVMGQKELNKDWVICPKCKGSKKVILEAGEYKEHYTRCWYCNGTGEVNQLDEIRGLLFEAMASNNVHLRQKCLWKFVKCDIEKAIALQISIFEESISAGLEEDYLIEEYKDHLARFKDWSDYFLMDAKVIYKLRNQDGSEGQWIKR